MRSLVVVAVALAGCAGAPVRETEPAPAAFATMVATRPAAPVAPAPEPEPVVAPEPPPPVAFGSEDPEAQGGTWVAPELLELVTRLEATKARPTRVTWLGGNAAKGCREAWRFRLIYGAPDRFANVSAFRSRDDARVCEDAFRKEYGADPAVWAKLEPLLHRAGPYVVVLTGTLATEDELRAALNGTMDELRFEKATEVPVGELPAGAMKAFYQRPSRKERPRPRPR